MERLCRVVAALLLLISFNLRIGICSYDAQQGTASHREEDVHSAARAIQAIHIREALRQPSRYRSKQHFGSKAGWPNLGAYPPPAFRSWYTGRGFQGSSFPPPSSSSSPNPYRTPNQPPSFPQWPPWPWTPNLRPPTTTNFPPLMQGSGSPSAPAPAPSPVVAKPLASPRQAEKPAHSVALPPEPARKVTHGAAVVTGGAAEAKKPAPKRPIYVIAAAGASLLAMSVALFVLCYRSNKVVTVRPWATGLSGQLQKAFVTGVPALKRPELELACEDFSNVIGSLSDYMMYKGTLSSGVEIAVISTTKKSAREWSKHCETQFRKKITSLSRVNHKNFVNLLGYCEQEQQFTRMMVFEYAPNGTLFEHLHEREDGHLDWPTRLRVAVGVAYCLEHMHQLSPPEILKALDTSTIYLTDDFAAKIADVVFCEEAGRDTTILQSPVLSDRESVVYSYGMVLLEIMSGRFTASEGGFLEGWAASFLRGERQLRDLMDPGLSRDATLHGETVERLDGVIRSCTDREARRRLTMPEVARRLREITAMPPHAATPKVSPLWWAELEIISTEAT